MKSFKQFYKQVLLEGGNVAVDGHQADKIDLTKVSREKATTEIRDFLLKLNSIASSQFKTPIWKDVSVLDKEAFNGSSEAFFDKNIPDEKFIKVKRMIGDIDITTPAEHKEMVNDLLNGLKGKNITPNVKFIGHNKEEKEGLGHQINALFQIKGLDKTPLNVQIDFEFVGYEGSKPTEFAKFSHSSHFDDLNVGLKGVHHKFLLNALVSGASNLTQDDIVLFTKAATAEKPRVAKFPEGGTSKITFSVDRGLRQRLIPVLDKNGKQIQQDGKPVYKEQEVEDSEYTTNVLDIAKHIFGVKFQDSDLPKFWSFVGIVDLMKKYSKPDVVQRVADKFAFKLWGRGQQHINQTVEEDSEVKDAGWNALMKAFPTINQSKTMSMRDEYYKGFDERQAAMNAKRGVK